MPRMQRTNPTRDAIGNQEQASEQRPLVSTSPHFFIPAVALAELVALSIRPMDIFWPDLEQLLPIQVAR